MSAQTRSREHYLRQQSISAAAVKAVRDVLGVSVSPAAVALVVSRYQALAAVAASETIAAESGAAASVVNAAALAGATSLGYPLTDPLAPLLKAYKRQVVRSLLPWRSPAVSYPVDRFVASEVQDAGRTAGQVQIFSTSAHSRYVRVLTPPSCPRCAVLAGRIYRDSEAFDRHPLCDCVHWPVESAEQAVREGLIIDPQTAFEQGQVRGVSRADLRAIRDGADIGQVVNARRGLGTPGITSARTADVFGRRLKITVDGTTRGSAWRRANPTRPFRLRPEAIYQLAEDRADALRLLKVYGYLK